MNRTEAPMTNDEIEIIRTKVNRMKVFIIVFIIFLLFWGWGLSDTNEVFTILNGIIFCIFFISLIFITLIAKKLLLTKNDYSTKIKLLSDVRVTEKYYTGTKSRRYTLKLDSEDIHRYFVSKKIYNEISIGDTIQIEYSKCAFWILKIEHNGVNIENKNTIG